MRHPRQMLLGVVCRLPARPTIDREGHRPAKVVSEVVM